METVVLPAQNHLVKEWHSRHDTRGMAGMIYPLGSLPRTRRKVRSPSQDFVSVSRDSEGAKLSSDRKDVHVVDSTTRSGLESPMDMSLRGVLQSNTSSSSSSSRLPPLSILKTQYRLINTSPPPTGQRQILRTRSEGELLQQGLKKGVGEGGERLSFEKKKSHEKGAKGSKSSAAERKVVEKNAEKPSADRRKGVERKAVMAEKKVSASAPGNQGDNNSSKVLPPKKAGVITILQRPQTKEAAAENIALFTGRPIDDVTRQILQYNPAGSRRPIEDAISKKTLKVDQLLAQQHSKKSSIELSAAVYDAELVKDAETKSKERKETDNTQSRRGSRDGSPKRVPKKKTSNYAPGTFAAWVTDLVQAESQRTLDANVDGDTLRRPKTATRPAEVAAPVEGPISNDSEFSLHAEKLGGHEALLKVLDFSASDIEGNQEPNILDRKSSWSGVSGEATWDQVVSDLRRERSHGFPGTLHRWSSESSIADIEHALSDGRQAGTGVHGDENKVKLYFYPTSPTKHSERWAGPAYTNSPPPSTLPFPTFPLQQVKLGEVVLQQERQDPNSSALYTDPISKTLFSSAPPSPTQLATLFSSTTVTQQSPVDPLSATKDLKRMLNLDMDSGGAAAAKWMAGAVESATQSLKQVLQLE